MNNKDFRLQIQELVTVDQKELADLSSELGSANSVSDRLALIEPVARKCQKRSEFILKILGTSGVKPTISNIGEEGSAGVILLALHSYLEVMEKVNALYHRLLDEDPSDVPSSYLAVLVDRISIIKDGKQVLGTNNYYEDGKEYFIPIVDIGNLNHRRLKYNLKSLDIKVISSQQKLMTESEFAINFAFMDKKIKDSI